MEAVNYRALFWQAFDGLCALECGAGNPSQLPDADALSLVQGAAMSWRARIERQLPEPDEAGWPTDGPYAATPRKAESNG